MLSREGKQTDRGAVGAEFIGDNRRRREALLLQEFPHQPNCRPSVPAGLNQEIQDFALTVPRHARDRTASLELRRPSRPGASVRSVVAAGVESAAHRPGRISRPIFELSHTRCRDHARQAGPQRPDGLVRANWLEPTRRGPLASRNAKSLPIFQQFTRDHPAHCDDVCPVPAVAAAGRGPAVRAWHRHLPRDRAVLVEPVRSAVCSRDPEASGSSSLVFELALAP